MKILPPRATMISLLAQIPGVVWHWPLHPHPVAVVAGATLMAIAAVLNFWADRVFKTLGVGIVPFSHAENLAGVGPFRLTRNPMYLGLAMFSAGVALACGVFANLVAPLLFWVWLHYSYVLPEERFLTERFGDAFLAYKARVPRWL